MNNASIEIEAPPQTIFEYITNPRHLKSWQPDVVEPGPLPPGGLRVGAHVGATVQEYGRRFDVDLLVAAMTRNENITYRMEGPTVSAMVEYRLVQWGAHTRVVNNIVVKPKGILRRLHPFVNGIMNKIVQWRMQSRLRMLRDAVESQA